VTANDSVEMEVMRQLSSVSKAYVGLTYFSASQEVSASQTPRCATVPATARMRATKGLLPVFLQLLHPLLLGLLVLAPMLGTIHLPTTYSTKALAPPQ